MDSNHSSCVGHNNLVRNVVASPTDSGVLTCSDDYRARYFVSEGSEMQMF